jgi:hypothetical protein
MLSIIVLAVVILLPVAAAVMRAAMSFVAHPIAFIPKAIRWIARLIGGIFVLAFVVVLLAMDRMTVWSYVEILIPAFVAFAISWLMDRWLDKLEPDPVIEVRHYYENEDSSERRDGADEDVISVHDESIK